MSQFDPNRIIVALDVDSLAAAREIVESLSGTGVTYKIGNQLATREGWTACIEFIHASGAEIFCDSKFKDIPETVQLSCRALADQGPAILNVMADTDPAVLRAARAGVNAAKHQPLLIGVTVLTSFSDDASNTVYGAPSADKVLQFARQAAEAGLDGVVCSSNEATLLRAHPETAKLLLITPGIRPEWAVTGDQTRIMTPRQAIEAGADYLVIGRPITQPPPEIGSPRDAFDKIMEEING